MSQGYRIKVRNAVATIRDGQVICDDALLKQTLELFNHDILKGPHLGWDPDWAIAQELATKALGEVIDQKAPPSKAALQEDALVAAGARETIY